MNNENKRVQFPTFECYWCKQDIGDGTVPHDCNETPKLDMKDILDKLKEHVSKIEWLPMLNEEDTCFTCKTLTLERSRSLFNGPWSGSVRCTACDYRDSFMSYVGRKSIIVEPLDKP